MKSEFKKGDVVLSVRLNKRTNKENKVLETVKSVDEKFVYFKHGGKNLIENCTITDLVELCW